MKRPENVILRGETRLFLSVLLAIILSVCAAANVFAAPFAYITNLQSATVSVIDTSSNSVVATIPVGVNPIGVAVSPAATGVYVTNGGAYNGTGFNGNTVSVIDTTSNTVAQTITGVGPGPYGVAINPAGTRVYVTNYGPTATPSTVSVIDTSNNTVIAAIPVGIFPAGVVVSPDGSVVYVGNYGSNTISVINAQTNLVSQTIAATAPGGLALNPPGTRLYVGHYYGPASISVYDTATLAPLPSVPLAFVPWAVSVNPAGTRLYTSNTWSSGVSVIDTGNNTVLPTINVGSLPHGLALDPTGSRLYVAQAGANSVGVIDTSSNAVIANVTVGNYPVAFGKFIGPALNSAPVANAGQDQTPYVGNTVTLDGSGSYDVDGNLLTFKWVFTSVPTESTATLSDSTSVNPTFTIDKAGTYVVSLTVNDGTVDSAADTVTISTLNSAPVADAGTDQTPYVNDTVTLNGSGSYDVDGNLLTYSWAFTTVPQGSAASLVNPTSVNPTFTVDKAGTYVVSLIVNDGTVNSVPDTVTITADVEAEVEIKPETINLKSKGKFKAFIELPEPYSVDEVVLATVVCEGAHAIDGRVDGEDRYIATFNTQDLRITVSSKEEEVTLTVSGELEDGTKFTGSDTVKVKGKDKDR